MKPLSFEIKLETSQEWQHQPTDPRYVVQSTKGFPTLVTLAIALI